MRSMIEVSAIMVRSILDVVEQADYLGICRATENDGLSRESTLKTVSSRNENLMRVS